MSDQKPIEKEGQHEEGRWIGPAFATERRIVQGHCGFRVTRGMGDYFARGLAAAIDVWGHRRKI